MDASDLQVVYKKKYATAKYRCQYPFFVYGCKTRLVSIEVRPFNFRKSTSGGLQPRHLGQQRGSISYMLLIVSAFLKCLMDRIGIWMVRRIAYKMAVNNLNIGIDNEHARKLTGIAQGYADDMIFGH